MLAAIVIHRRLYRRPYVRPLAVAGVVAVGAGRDLAVLLARRCCCGTRRQLHPGPVVRPGPDPACRRGARLLRRVPPLPARPDRPLALMAIGGLVLYGYGWLVGESNFGRVLRSSVPRTWPSACCSPTWVERRDASEPCAARRGPRCRPSSARRHRAGLLRVVPRAVLPASERDAASLQPITKPYDDSRCTLPSGQW